MDVISELVGVPRVDRAELRRLADLVVHREEGFSTSPRRGWRRPSALAGYYAGDGRDRRGTAQRRPDLGAARRRHRRRPAHRRRDHLLPLPDGGGRQRDHHQAAGQRLVLGLALPRPAGQALRRPGRVAGLGGGDPALRHLDADAAAGHPGADRACTGPRSPTASGSCCWSARPTGTRRSSPTPTATTSTATPVELVSFGSGRHFCLGAALARLEARVGSERAGATGSPTTRSTRPGSSGSTRSTCGASPACRPPVGRCADGRRVRSAHPDAPPGRRSPARRRASAGPRRGRWPRRAIPWCSGPAGSSRCEDVRPRSGPTAARPWPSPSTWPTRVGGAVRRGRGRGGRRRRHPGLQRRHRTSPGAALDTQPEAFAALLAVNLVGAHRLVGPWPRPWSSAATATSSS